MQRSIPARPRTGWRRRQACASKGRSRSLLRRRAALDVRQQISCRAGAWRRVSRNGTRPRPTNKSEPPPATPHLATPTMGNLLSCFRPCQGCRTQLPEHGDVLMSEASRWRWCSLMSEASRWRWCSEPSERGTGSPAAEAAITIRGCLSSTMPLVATAFRRLTAPTANTALSFAKI
jgi:hypothetical protein